MPETTAHPTIELFSLDHDFDPPPYVTDHIDLAALRALPPKARARRVREIVAERNPKLSPDSISFGRLVTALNDLTKTTRRRP